MLFELTHLFQGFASSLALIAAIGAQNAFVLKQGMMRQHVFMICSLCVGMDFVLMNIGIWSIGAIPNDHPALLCVMALGILFLITYSVFSLRSAYFGNNALTLDNQSNNTVPLTRIISLTLSFTLLNPHVYLDTVVLLGSIASPLVEGQKINFTIGALLGTAVWFFGLGYGARFLTPLFAKPKAWRVLDVLIAMILTCIAFNLSLDLHHRL